MTSSDRLGEAASLAVGPEELAGRRPDAAGTPAAPDLATVFDLLSDETRIRIVRALAADAAGDGEPGLSFTALRTRVGTRDEGRFNYHLGRLRGELVEKADRGYVLTRAGEAVGALVVDGSAPADGRSRRLGST